ncbi:hypothetical protein [Kribbella albertanoniae]|uniref:Copper resistance protein CopC n=1 Tax=Kribbella albertanoniae TaxID=1266829 RepID=A0A4R4PLQ3_9ACTN|nr:hypothetical protein [Kribbella albertanoniae]TDC23032.1 hypothetical protein E1261_29385 [Kribbella albertanoniae]
MRKQLRKWVVLMVVLVIAMASPLPAQAHGVSPTADLQLAQTFAGNDLTIVLRRTPEVPGPLQVEVFAHTPVRPTTLTLAIAGQPHNAHLKLVSPGVQAATLHVERAGEQVLELRAGDQHATIPFRVLVDRLATWEIITYGGFAAAGLLMITSLGSAVLRRSSIRALAVPQAVGAVLALVVAATTAGLSKDLPPAVPDGAPPTTGLRADAADGSAPNGRPYVNLRLSTQPANPRTGQEFDLVLSLTDGSSGRPADDLVAHHAALIHTVITSQAGREFRHVHPVRTAPGVLTVRLSVRTPGKHLLYAEFERADSGAQLVSGSFQVAGAQLPPQAKDDGVDVQVALSPRHVVAGRPVTIQAEVSANGRPVRDLQPWLGMAGHLVIRDASGNFFGHVHELTSMAAQARRSATKAPLQDETVAREGPTLRFTYTFPAPGRYLVWVQFARAFRIHTVPLTIDVAKGQP